MYGIVLYCNVLYCNVLYCGIFDILCGSISSHNKKIGEVEMINIDRYSKLFSESALLKIFWFQQKPVNLFTTYVYYLKINVLIRPENQTTYICSYMSCQSGYIHSSQVSCYFTEGFVFIRYFFFVLFQSNGCLISSELVYSIL